MVKTRGRSTKTAYMVSAGAADSQPIMVSRRSTLLKEIHREDVGTAERLSGVTVDVTDDLVGTEFARLLLLSEFSLVFCLDSLQESGSILFAADHLLQFRCPALGEDRAC